MNESSRQQSSRKSRVRIQQARRARVSMLETLESRTLMAALMEVRLDALALDGVTPITEITRGSDFLLRGQAIDLSASPQGALQVYTNIGYNPNEVSPVVGEVQRLDFTGDPVGGTFTLTYNGVTTAPINYLPSGQGQSQALSIQNALNALPELSGNVHVDRDNDTSITTTVDRYYIRFINALGDTDVSLITADGAKLQPNPAVTGSTAGINLIEYAAGLRSNAKAFAQAFSYNGKATAVNDTLNLFPDLRRALDGTNEFDQVGGAADLFNAPGSGLTTFFIARLTATTGGADNAVDFTASYPLDGKGNPIPGSELELFPSTLVAPSKVNFTYGTDGKQTGKLHLAVVAPVITTPDKFTVLEDSAIAPLKVSPLANDLQFPASASNPPLTITAKTNGDHGGTVNIINNGKNLNYQPAPNFFGTEKFTYVASNQNGDSDVGQVTVTVTNVNDIPSFTKGADQAIDEDAGLVTVTNWATGISAGANEAGAQTVDFILTNSKPGLFATQPTVSANGTLSYKTAANQFGTATITLKIHDNGGTANGGVDTSATQTFTIAVASVNDAPINLLPTTLQSTVTTTPLVFSGANAISVKDVDAFAAAIKTTLTVTNGKLKLGSTPAGLTITGDNSSAISMTGKLADINTALTNLKYTADAGFLGSETLTIVTNDQGNSGKGGALSDTDTLPLIVRSSTLPFATPIKFTVEAGSSDSDPGNRFDVLASDFAHPGSKPTLVSFGNATILAGRDDNGTPNDLTDDAILYAPPANFTGTQVFNYTINDTAAGSKDSTGTITVTVVPKTNNPKPQNDTYAATEDTVLTVAVANSVLLNDVDPLNGKLTAIVASQPAHGSVTLSADGSFKYTPDANFAGADTFTYNAKSDQTGTLTSLAPATVTINVANVNDPPVVVDQTYKTLEEKTLTVNVAGGLLKGATDADSDKLTAVVVTQPTKGTLTAQADGSFVYVPKTGVFGTDTFTYQAKDPSNALSNTGTVTITITKVNHAPVAVNDSGYVGFKDKALAIDAALSVLLNDTDSDGDSLTAQLSAQPANGKLSLNSDGSFTYTPKTGFIGTDTFKYIAVDNSNAANNKSAPATVMIKINATNTPPTAVDQIFNAKEDTKLVVAAAAGLTVGGVDAEGAKLTASIASQPAKGTLTAQADGSFAYQPFANAFGTDSFTYQLSDGFAKSTVHTATIKIAGVNDPPPVVNDKFSVQNDVSYQTLPDVLANDRLAKNVDGPESLSLASFDSFTKQGGTMSIDANGRLHYTPPTGFSGTDSFKYRVSDPAGATSTGYVTLNVRFVPRSDVSGFVYRDLQGNGVFDANEEGMGGVNVELKGTDLDGNPLDIVSQTDSTGAYQFTSVAPGSYKIIEMQPRYIQDGLDQIGTQGGTAGNDVFSFIIPKTGLTAGQGINNNFGEGNLDLSTSAANPQLKFTSDEILSSSARAGILLGYDGGQQTWYNPVDPSWENLAGIFTSLSQDGRELLVNINEVVNGVLRTYQTTLEKAQPNSAALGFRVMATNNQDFQIIRIVGALDLSQFTLLGG